ncbi:basic salivary proline-rich protein 1 [Cyclospora cayetanensis]|uniref:Basic salivary proline-rich protein 1 n=1 Tax=Cyclospora cayetanensis TaxID=88456 RepID=A0A6P6RXC2_9EIME|nr:basic salivary proline-rich protein 1 [Cyclospora cayetanensis]
MRPRAPLPPQAALAAQALGGGPPGPEGPWGPRDQGGPMPSMGAPPGRPQHGRGRVSWMPFGGGPMGLRPPFGPLGAPGVPPFLPMGNAGGPHGPAGPQGSGGPMGPPPMGAFPKGPNGMPPPLEGAPGPGGPPFLEPGGSPQGVGPGQHMQPPPPPFLRAVGGRGGSHSSGLPLEAAPSATGTEAQSRMRGPQMGTAPPMGLEMGGAPHHPRAGPPFFMAAHMHLQGGPGMPPPPPPEAFGMRGMPPDWVHGPPGGPPIGPSIPHLGPLMHPPQGDPACSAAAGDVAAFSGYTTGEGPLRTGEQGGPPLGGSPVPRGDIVDGQQQQAGVGVGGLVDAGEEAAVTKTPEEAEEEALFAWLEQTLVTATPEKLMQQVGPLLQPQDGAAAAAAAAGNVLALRGLSAFAGLPGPSTLRLLLELKDRLPRCSAVPLVSSVMSSLPKCASPPAAEVKAEEEKDGGPEVSPPASQRVCVRGVNKNEEGAESKLPPLCIHSGATRAGAAARVCPLGVSGLSLSAATMQLQSLSFAV